jgi:hypothetical protein
VRSYQIHLKTKRCPICKIPSYQNYRSWTVI